MTEEQLRLEERAHHAARNGGAGSAGEAQLLASVADGPELDQPRRKRKRKTQHTTTSRMLRDRPIITALGRASRQPSEAPFSQQSVLQHYHDSMATQAAEVSTIAAEQALRGSDTEADSSASGNRGGRGGRARGAAAVPGADAHMDPFSSAASGGGMFRGGIDTSRSDARRLERAVESGTAESVLYVLGCLAR